MRTADRRRFRFTSKNGIEARSELLNEAVVSFNGEIEICSVLLGLSGWFPSFVELTSSSLKLRISGSSELIHRSPILHHLAEPSTLEQRQVLKQDEQEHEAEDQADDALDRLGYWQHPENEENHVDHDGQDQQPDEKRDQSTR